MEILQQRFILSYTYKMSCSLLQTQKFGSSLNHNHGKTYDILQKVYQ